MSALVVGFVMVAVGAAVVWLAWLGSQRHLPRNGWAGIRMPSTMRSDEAWAAAHEAAAGPFGISGGILVCGGVAVGVSGLDNVVGLAAVTVGLVGSLVAMAVAATVARRAAKAT